MQQTQSMTRKKLRSCSPQQKDDSLQIHREYSGCPLTEWTAVLSLFLVFSSASPLQLLWRKKKKEQHQVSHFRSCWQLNSTVSCSCLNLLLTKCSRPDALNSEGHDLSILQIQHGEQLTTKYLLFLTCHWQDTWAKRNYFNLSSLLRLPVNKAMGTHCYHDYLLGKAGKKPNTIFACTGSHFGNLGWDPPMISNSDYYLCGTDLNWFTA